jgi:hypothetical protein
MRAKEKIKTCFMRGVQSVAMARKKSRRVGSCFRNYQLLFSEAPTQMARSALGPCDQHAIAPLPRVSHVRLDAFE